MFPVQSRASEHDHQIHHIETSLRNNFHLQQTVLVFCIKFAQKNGVLGQNRKIQHCY